MNQSKLCKEGVKWVVYPQDIRKHIDRVSDAQSDVNRYRKYGDPGWAERLEIIKRWSPLKNQPSLIKVDFNNDDSQDIIYLTKDINPVKFHNIGGIKIYFAYQMSTQSHFLSVLSRIGLETHDNKILYKDLIGSMRAIIKHPYKNNRAGIQTIRNLSWNKLRSQVDLMVKVAVDRFNSLKPISEYSVIIPAASTSDLNNKIVERMLKYADKNVVVAKDAVIKNTMGNLQIDYDKLNKIDPFYREKTEKILKNLQRHPEDPFEIKKIYDPKYRRFFTHFLKFKNPEDRELFKAITGGNLLFVDDTFGSGQTSHEMLRLVKSYGPGEVYMFALLKDY